MDGPASERITIPEIIDAVTSALANARIEGEPYKSKAEEYLGPFETILLRISLERMDTRNALHEVQTTLDRLTRQAEATLDKKADELWEHLGSPDYDPIYNLMFPSAPPSTTDARAFAERLSLVADLLSAGMHPKIDRTRAAFAAQEIRQISEEFHEQLYVLLKHQGRDTALDNLEASVARIGLLELGSLRRALRGCGADENRIKSVVPPPISSRRFSFKP